MEEDAFLEFLAQVFLGADENTDSCVLVSSFSVPGEDTDPLLVVSFSITSLDAARLAALCAKRLSMYFSVIPPDFSIHRRRRSPFEGCLRSFFLSTFGGASFSELCLDNRSKGDEKIPCGEFFEEVIFDCVLDESFERGSDGGAVEVSFELSEWGLEDFAERYVALAFASALPGRKRYSRKDPCAGVLSWDLLSLYLFFLGLDPRAL